MDNLTSVGKRLKAPTPKFWQKVRNISGAIVAAGLFITMTPLGLPAGILVFTKYAIAIATTAATLAQATASDKPVSDSVVDSFTKLSKDISNIKNMF